MSLHRPNRTPIPVVTPETAPPFIPIPPENISAISWRRRRRHLLHHPRSGAATARASTPSR
ncbi:hypothetical protein C5F48_06890 [Cereibacter changlensis JA139]|uniref:Uncharacterized protein n=1 Tax=Cereibacter changlensis JA139 TaxID=1188249 RepID=A0A2T4JXK1_9RHOB|nr:hypothetical protein C5F48_06890 [Cereibacter changlensis JA139]